MCDETWGEWRLGLLASGWKCRLYQLESLTELLNFLIALLNPVPFVDLYGSGKAVGVRA